MHTIKITAKKLALRIGAIVLFGLIAGAVECSLMINGNHSAAAVIAIFIVLIFYSLAFPESEESKQDFHEGLYK